MSGSRCRWNRDGRHLSVLQWDDMNDSLLGPHGFAAEEDRPVELRTPAPRAGRPHAFRADTLEPPAHDFYVAGPFFDPGQIAQMERLEAVLEAHGRTMFKPRFASDIAKVGPEGCFADDVAGIRTARAVIANLKGEDTGTMFEVGYAYALGLPVYGYYEGLTHTDRINLMISQSVSMVFSGPDDLAHWLETGEHIDIDYIQF